MVVKVLPAVCVSKTLRNENIRVARDGNRAARYAIRVAPETRRDW